MAAPDRAIKRKPVPSTQHASTERKAFVYDEPKEFLYRLFQLDPALDDTCTGTEDAPLRGRLISLTFNYSLHDLSKTFLSIFGDNAELIVERLSGSTRYMALSYRWGDNHDRFPLHIDTIAPDFDKDGNVTIGQDNTRDGWLWITRNLRDFLLGWRKSSERTRFLWIDAICIDQSNPEDKELQIRRMKDIYDSANQVLVYLGPATETETGALRIISNITEKLRAVTAPLDATTIEKAFADLGLPEPDHMLWAAYSEIFKREYWSRLWCLQEVVVASSVKDSVTYVDMYDAPRAIILCGETRTSWEAFDNFVEALERSGLKRWLITGQHHLACDDLHGIDAIAETRTARASMLRYGWAPSLSAVLVATRRRTATVDADMVWGMLSLLDRASIRELALTRTMSTEEVFLRFGKHYLRNEVKECLLNHTATKERLSVLPSWCPNFASREETIAIGTRWLGHNQETSPFLDQMPCAGFQRKGKWKQPRRKLFYANAVVNHFSGKQATHGQYNTTNPRQISLLDSPDNAILASGIELDVVTEVITRNPAADSLRFLSYHSVLQTIFWDQECFDLARRTLGLSDELALRNMYARTVTANRVTMDLPSLSSNLSWNEFSKTWSYTPLENLPVIHDREGTVDFATPYAQLREAMEGIESSETLALQGHATKRFAECLRAMTRGRTFFATKNGRIGLGPSNAAPGDKVVVIFYCPTPYLIRKGVSEQSSWTFVGEAYIHGLMYGEALQMFDRGEVSETKWVIS